MTVEEQKEFKEKIIETIIPLAINMTEDQIKNIIKVVESENKDIPKGFGSMLFEQIMIQKYKNNKL
ncbi:hypothetical protein GCM10012288_09790 [Malaciobacter pacificus]|jgi:hypothetical protein|uniref:Uncharacterized protein n=1 Tax=Malaciobacter pacificus TaxID=1080223 RepID=A0A5C2H6X7_9BACT|nr:hypothetical protein [Malaciobacter pacificus]QEP34573.1 hypothetical protein APAC_1464 [Malaciobacter pacificus]GGD37757.1 hypothetical protein GCM10012288_09790 [Malaciobacter pacificus]